MQRTVCALVCMFFLSFSLLHAESIYIDFETLDGWRTIRFIAAGKESSYFPERLDGDNVLQIKSDDGISGIVFDKLIDLEETPILEWRWRIEDFPSGADLRFKETDDSPLRLYVMFEYENGKMPLSERLKYSFIKVLYGEFPPKSILGFVSTENEFLEPVLQSTINSRTRYVDMNAYATACDGDVADGHSGTPWCTAEADIVAIATGAFGELPSSKARIALIGDSDSTRDNTIGYLDYVEVRARP